MALRLFSTINCFLEEVNPHRQLNESQILMVALAIPYALDKPFGKQENRRVLLSEHQLIPLNEGGVDGGRL